MVDREAPKRYDGCGRAVEEIETKVSESEPRVSLPVAMRSKGVRPEGPTGINFTINASEEGEIGEFQGSHSKATRRDF